MVAVACLGMLLRSIVDDEMGLWGLWVVLVLLSCSYGAYIFWETL